MVPVLNQIYWLRIIEDYFAFFELFIIHCLSMYTKTYTKTTWAQVLCNEYIYPFRKKAA